MQRPYSYVENLERNATTRGFIWGFLAGFVVTVLLYTFVKGV